jgi:hypothetical protein
VILACADAGLGVRKIVWLGWGQPVAAGVGTAFANDCTPTCAAGHFHRYPAVLLLSGRQRCADKIAYRKATVAIVGESPPAWRTVADATYPLRCAATRVSSARERNQRPRCSAVPVVAARYIVPPPPFAARVVSVRRRAVPAGEPREGGSRFKRLYLVTFAVSRGNAVLPAGHRYSQFAYVMRNSAQAPWCFLKGGSGP